LTATDRPERRVGGLRGAGGVDREGFGAAKREDG